MVRSISARKPINLPTSDASAAASRPVPLATAVTIASNTTAIRSSNTRIENTTSVNPPFQPSSSNAFATSIVLEIPRHAPANTAMVGGNPSARATSVPIATTSPTSNSAVSAPAMPRRANVLSGNSSPIVNMSRITPSCEST